MKYSHYLIMSFFALLAGGIMVAIHYDWLIVRLPQKSTALQKTYATGTIERKKVALHFWKNSTWHKETCDILVSHDLTTTLEHLINAWLAILDEEHILDKKVTLQSILLTQSDQAYVSFDRSPFSKEAPVFNKMMLIEGLLRTIRENGGKVREIQFLVHHKPLQDYHLDFSNPWPIQGFLSNQATL